MTREVKHNKLVRDKIIEIIESEKRIPFYKILDEQTYYQELLRKLQEECLEVEQATSEEVVEELADLLEVMMAIGKMNGFTLDDIIETAKQKNEKRGSFNDKIFLEKVIE